MTRYIESSLFSPVTRLISWIFLWELQIHLPSRCMRRYWKYFLFLWIDMLMVLLVLTWVSKIVFSFSGFSWAMLSIDVYFDITLGRKMAWVSCCIWLWGTWLFCPFNSNFWPKSYLLCLSFSFFFFWFLCLFSLFSFRYEEGFIKGCGKEVYYSSQTTNYSRWAGIWLGTNHLFLEI